MMPGKSQKKNLAPKNKLAYVIGLLLWAGFIASKSLINRSTTDAHSRGAR